MKPMTTVAIYQHTENGWLRVGLFSPRKATSARHIAVQYFAHCPNAPRGKMYATRRYRINGTWADDIGSRFLLET
jgi:hypothetical protein